MPALKPNEYGVSTIYLMLGAACNYKCRHCIQSGEKPSVKKRVSDEVVSYIKRLAAARSPKHGKRIRVLLWGGEPLLYMDAIRDVVAKIGDAVDYTIISNGSLLTQEIVDWINANKIAYTLSNDGINTAAVRGENVLEDEVFRQLFCQIEIKAIDAVVSAHNQDYQALWAYLDEKVPGVNVNYEALQCVESLPDDIADFDFARYSLSCHQAREQFKVDALAGNYSREVRLLEPAVKRVMSVVKAVEQKKPVDMYPACGMGRHAINVDLQGNVYPCHNSATPLGTVADPFPTLLERTEAVIAKHMVETVASKGCERCVAYPLCRGGCPFTPGSHNQAKACAAQRIFFNTAIATVMDFATVGEPMEF